MESASSAIPKQKGGSRKRERKRTSRNAPWGGGGGKGRRAWVSRERSLSSVPVKKQETPHRELGLGGPRNSESEKKLRKHLIRLRVSETATS